MSLALVKMKNQNDLYGITDHFQSIKLQSQALLNLVNIFYSQLPKKANVAKELNGDPISKIYFINIDENTIGNNMDPVDATQTSYAHLIVKEDYQKCTVINRFTKKEQTLFILKGLTTLINNIHCEEKRTLAIEAVNSLNDSISKDLSKKTNTWFSKLFYSYN